MSDPGLDRSPRLLCDLELHRALRLLLKHDRSTRHAFAMCDISHAQFDQVARSQFAVDGKIEQRKIAGGSRS